MKGRHFLSVTMKLDILPALVSPRWNWYDTDTLVARNRSYLTMSDRSGITISNRDSKFFPLRDSQLIRAIQLQRENEAVV